MKVVYTGSFDPPTVGHKAVLMAALNADGVTSGTVMVNITGPKVYKATFEQRRSMLLAMLADAPVPIEILPVRQEDKGPMISAMGPVCQVIGEDSWHKLPAARMQEQTWIVVRRPGYEQGSIPNSGRVKVLELPSIEGISSSSARKALAAGLQAPVDPRVACIIYAAGLYR